MPTLAKGARVGQPSKEAAGLPPLPHLTQDLRPGLTYFAPPGLVSCGFSSTVLIRGVVLTHTLLGNRFTAHRQHANKDP